MIVTCRRRVIGTWTILTAFRKCLQAPFEFYLHFGQCSVVRQLHGRWCRNHGFPSYHWQPPFIYFHEWKVQSQSCAALFLFPVSTNTNFQCKNLPVSSRIQLFFVNWFISVKKYPYQNYPKILCNTIGNPKIFACSIFLTRITRIYLSCWYLYPYQPVSQPPK